MERKMDRKTNIADISKNTRVKSVKLAKDSLDSLRTQFDAIETAIAAMNSSANLPGKRANDLLGRKVGKDYLQAASGFESNEQYGAALAKLHQAMTAAKRRLLEVEKLAK